MSIEKKNKLGEGAYGIVYAASVNKANRSLKVAVKRNYGDEENIGISCIREMNFLSLFSHFLSIMQKQKWSRKWVNTKIGKLI